MLILLLIILRQFNFSGTYFKEMHHLVEILHASYHIQTCHNSFLLARGQNIIFTAYFVLQGFVRNLNGLLKLHISWTWEKRTRLTICLLWIAGFSAEICNEKSLIYLIILVLYPSVQYYDLDCLNYSTQKMMKYSLKLVNLIWYFVL